MATLTAHTTTSSTVQFQSSFVIQNVSEQDWATNGSNLNKHFDFLVVADSHGRAGNQYFVELLKNINWHDFLEQDDWQQEIIHLTKGKETSKIGSTLTVWKIFEERFECSWIGDSSGKIWAFEEDGKTRFTWKTKDHDCNNKDDYETMMTELVDFPNFTHKATWDIQAVSSERMLSVKSKMFKIDTESINMTRALGHMGLFSKLGFQTVQVPRIKKLTYKIVTGSDGFWQVMSDKDEAFISDKNCFAQRLATAARKRWEQKWEHDNSMGTVVKNIGIPSHNWDDVAVATWSN